MQSRLRVIAASDNYGCSERLVNRIWRVIFRCVGGAAERISSAASVLGRAFLFCEVLSFIYP
jgi:hypothetical protein